MGDWKECKLGEVAEIVGGGTPKTKESEYWNGEIAWLTPRDLSNFNGRYISKGERNISKLGLAKSSAKILPKGVVLLSSRAPVGYLAIAKNEVSTNQGFRNLISNSETNNLFLFYLLKNNVEYLKSQSTGTTFGELAGSTLKSLSFYFPPLTEQKAIASVLSSLDDKIDLLHRQNKTLEAMAETLFRQWFVEEAKEDWVEVDLEYVTQRITDGAHKSPHTVEIGLPMASVKDMHQWGIHRDSCRKISETDYEELVRNDCRPLKNDIIIAKDGSYLKHVFVAPNSLDLVILSSIAILRPNGKYNPLLLSIFLKMNSTREALENIVTGAVIPRIVLKDFRKFKLTLPPMKQQIDALETIEPIYMKCWENVNQTHTLEKLRDTLLPKLMSGEVRVEYDTN